LGGLKSGKSDLKPPEDNGASEGSEIEESAEELADVDKPSKERQKVLPVDCTALGKAKQQLYHTLCILFCPDELVRMELKGADTHQIMAC
jgi:hypothetical protein